MEETSTAYEIGKAIGTVLGCFFLIGIPAMFVFTLIMAILRKQRGWVIAAISLGVVAVVGFGILVAFGIKEGISAAEEASKEKVFTTTDGLAQITRRLSKHNRLYSTMLQRMRYCLVCVLEGN
ncbi:MAG: hypothetical protein AAF357_05945 [Verrucomicrobiota bacterium]